MATLAKTTENNAIVKALKKIAGTKWTGTTIHTNLDACFIIDENLWKLLKDIQNPSWIRTYKSL